MQNLLILLVVALCFCGIAQAVTTTTVSRSTGGTATSGNLDLTYDMSSIDNAYPFVSISVSVTLTHSNTSEVTIQLFPATCSSSACAFTLFEQTLGTCDFGGVTYTFSNTGSAVMSCSGGSVPAGTYRTSNSGGTATDFDGWVRAVSTSQYSGSWTLRLSDANVAGGSALTVGSSSLTLNQVSLGTAVQCTNGNYYRLADYGMAVTRDQSGVFVANIGSSARVASTCGYRHAAPRTSTVDACMRAGINEYNASATWLAGSDTATSGTWQWPTTDSCPAHTFFVVSSAGAGTCSVGSYCPWSTGQPDQMANEHCLGTFSNGLWNDYVCSTLTTPQRAIVESIPCANTMTISSNTVITEHQQPRTYQFTANGVELQFDLGYQLPTYEVRIDTNNCVGCSVRIRANTYLTHGIVILNSGGNTERVIVLGDAASSVSHVQVLGGTEFRGEIALTAACSANGLGVFGTVATGDVWFNNVRLYDASSRTDVPIRLIMSTGNVYIRDSNVQMDFVHVVLKTNDRTIQCLRSTVNATGAGVSTTSDLGTYQWNAVSVGFATHTTNNAVATNTIDVQLCTLTGPNRGYFNYHRYQNVMQGSTSITDSIMTFDYKLRVRSHQNANVYMRNVTATMTVNNGQGPFTIGSAYNPSNTNVTILDSNLQSRNIFEIWTGIDVTARNSQITATNSIEVRDANFS